MTNIIKLIPVLFLIAVLGCAKDGHDHAPCASNSSTTVSYKSFIAPLMTSSCNSSGCHSISSNAGGHQFTTYAGVKEAVDHGHFYSVMASSSMPKSASKLPDSVLIKVKSWADACGPDN